MKGKVTNYAVTHREKQMFSVSAWTKKKKRQRDEALRALPKQKQNRYVKRGALTLKDLFHLPLHSLRAPDALYFALFFCRGKQLREREREREGKRDRLVIEGELGSQLGFNSLKWPCVYSFNPLNCTFKLACKSQRSLTVHGVWASVTVCAHVRVCVCVCAWLLMSSRTIIIPTSLC